MGDSYTFSLYFSVDDAEQLQAAAMAHEHAKGMTKADFTTPSGDIDISACARMLLDPGHLAGCKVFDSTAEGSE